MKKIEDLGRYDVIHCPTQKLFEQIINLNPKNECMADYWTAYEDRTCYRPNGADGKGNYGSLGYYEDNNCFVHDAEDFLPSTDSTLQETSESSEYEAILKKASDFREQSNDPDFDLDRLHEWLTSEDREPAQTKFTAGKLRNVAKEIEYQINQAKTK